MSKEAIDKEAYLIGQVFIAGLIAAAETTLENGYSHKAIAIEARGLLDAVLALNDYTVEN